MASIDLSDAFSWATSISRTRLTSVAGFGLQSTIDTDAVSDLQGVLHAIRQLKIPHVPYKDLRVVESIGEGVTFSVVKHLWGDKFVALKYIKQPIADKAEPRDAFRKRLKSALQEIVVMHHKPLAAHPNIVELLGYGWRQESGQPAPYIVVELGSLGGLRPFLQSQKPWDLRRKLIVAGDVAAGLMALHQAGIVHGDLKLDNVVCFRAWSRPTACQAKLCDFGHSIAVSGEPKNVYYYGTPRYLPPEALTQRDQPISSRNIHKCDIWAFGLALWEILLDGDVYFQTDWLHDPQYSRTDSIERSLDSSWTLLPSMSSATDVPRFSDVTDESSQWSQIFGTFDLSHLCTLACKAVDRLTCGSASSLGFARSYLRPLMKRTLHPDPKHRFSDIARWPIITDWQKASRYNALESKLAFHTHTSNLAFDIFRPDLQADIAWGVQVHIHDDLQSIVTGAQKSPEHSATSLQLALCKAFGFGCDIDLSNAATHLEAGLEHSLALKDFVGQPLQTGLQGCATTQTLPFADRIAVMLARQWDVDRHSVVSLCERPIDEPSSEDDQHVSESIVLGAIDNLQLLLPRAAKRTHSSLEAILSQSLVRFDSEGVLLSWLELAIFWNDSVFINTYRTILSDNQLNKVGSWTLSPLLFACVRGQTEMVTQLLDLGADPVMTTPDDCNLLHFLFCLRDQAVRILDEAVRRCPELVDKINLPCKRAFGVHAQWPTQIEGSPLAIAVTTGHLDLVQALLRHGANVQLPAFSSKLSNRKLVWTPMHLAVKYNFHDIVTLFVKELESSSLVTLCLERSRRVFSLNAYDIGFPLPLALSFLTSVERYGVHGSSSNTALEKTISLFHSNELYKSDSEGITAILQAIDFEDHDVVGALLKHEPALAVKRIPKPDDPSNSTLPLHFACQICSRKDAPYALRIPMEVLAARDSALTLVDSLGRSALYLAVMSEASLVARWLLDKGLDVNGRDFKSRTPLMLCQSAKTAMMLIERGAKPNLLDTDFKSAAHYAAFRGNHEILGLLLKHGVSLSSDSRSSYTLLHNAVCAVSLECVKLLCQAGAPVNAVAHDGCTPLHLAITTTPDIVQELVERGSDLTTADRSGRTPLRMAVEQFTGPTDESHEAQAIFESLIRPLHGDLETQKRNADLLAQILHVCAAHGNCTSIQIFLRCLGRETVITADTWWQGVSPLHAAASTINTDTAIALCAMPNMDVDAFDLHGRTALMYLSTLSSTNQEIERFCDLMCKAGARLDAMNMAGDTAWSIALRDENFKMLEYLLSEAPAEMSTEMLKSHPMTQECLLSAVDAGQSALVLAFSMRVQTMAPTYEPSLLTILAKACECIHSWEVVGYFMRRVYSEDLQAIREVLRGVEGSWALKTHPGVDDSPGLVDLLEARDLKRKVTSLWDQRAVLRPKTKRDSEDTLDTFDTLRKTLDSDNKQLIPSKHA